MITYNQLKHDIINLGVKPGDTILLRISYRAIGQTVGGPSTFIQVLLDVIGESGTIVSMGFPMPDTSSLFRIFHKKEFIMSPSKVGTGAIPMTMAHNEHSYVSTNTLFPYIAIGKHAKEICSRHTEQSKPYDLIEDIAINYNAKRLRIGGDFLNGTTHIAFSKGLRLCNQYQKRYGIGLYTKQGKKYKWNEIRVSIFCYKGYKLFADQYLSQYIIRRGEIGNGEADLTDLKGILYKEDELISKDPTILLCNDPYCWVCRCSYSYSAQSLLTYTITVIKGIMTNRIALRIGIQNILSAWKNVLFGIKVI